METWQWLFGYLLAVNLLAFCLFALDKKKARKGLWRISESMLFLWAFLGGTLGALLGMKTFHHKTKHQKFRVGLPLLLLFQITLIICFFVDESLFLAI